MIGDKNAFEALLSDRGDDGSTKASFEIVRTLCAQDCLMGCAAKTTQMESRSIAATLNHDCNLPKVCEMY